MVSVDLFLVDAAVEFAAYKADSSIRFEGGLGKGIRSGLCVPASLAVKEYLNENDVPSKVIRAKVYFEKDNNSESHYFVLVPSNLEIPKSNLEYVLSKERPNFEVYDPTWTQYSAFSVIVRENPLKDKNVLDYLFENSKNIERRDKFLATMKDYLTARK